MTLLTVSHLAKAYGGVPALVSASFSLAAGEVLALMGENGAGKSTLIKCLAGATRPDSGDIRIDGEFVKLAHPDDARYFGLRVIHQELNIVPQLSVAENLFLGRDYPRRFGGLINWTELNARARETLLLLNLDAVDPRRNMASLSTGDRMLVKIASAFSDRSSLEPRIFIMDEPTAALTGAECERLFQIISALKRKGCGILYVSHRMDEVMRLADRISILRDGETRATCLAAETSKEEVIALMTGRAANERPSSQTAASRGKAVVASTDLPESIVGDLAFALHEGEVLGIAGLAGSGREHLLRLLLDGKRMRRMRGTQLVKWCDPASAWSRGIAYVPGERRTEGIILSHSVLDNVTLPHLSRLSRMRLFLNRRTQRQTVDNVTRRVGLKAAGLSQRVWRLSGGNQQKVILARAILGNPRLLLLDEPTRGVDVGAKFDIHALLREVVTAGAAVILSSSDLSELIAMADRIAVLRAGRIVAIVATAGLTQAQLLALCYGGELTKEQHARGN